MSSTAFISANEEKEVKDLTLADYSFSFSLEKYQKLSGTCTALQILMHACNDMQIIPVDPIDLTLENIECVWDLLKDGCQWETHFFNTNTSTRHIQGKQVSFVETHAIIKCNTLLNRIRSSPKVMNTMKIS